MTFRLLCAALAMWVAPWAHAADDYPNRSIRLVVPFSAGGPDTTARILAQRLTTQLGQSVVVDNRPGANGLIGSEAVARSVPDGYTLMLTSSSFVINPSMYARMPYDSNKDFIKVAQVAAGEGLLFVVHPALPATTVKEFIALAKTPGRRVSFGSPGIGGNLHIAGELFNQQAGVSMVHIPYKGAGQAVTAVMSGELQAMFVTSPLALPQIKAGKLRPLAFTGATRASYLPDVPTIEEAGLPDFEIDAGWHGVFAPAGTPPAVIDRLRAEITAALANPDMRAAIEATGLAPSRLAPVDFPRTVDADITKYAELLRLAGVKPE